MKSFSISHEQLASVAAALTADELARNFHRYTDFVSQSEWTGTTRIGTGGLDLDDTQLSACASRLCALFDQPPTALEPRSGDCFDDWAERLLPTVHKAMQRFRFLPATHAGGAEMRHAADEIFQDAAVVASLMHGRRRVVSMVSTHSLFGFITGVIAPNLQGLAVLDGRRLAPDILQQTLDFGDLLIATPTLWRYLSETVEKFANNVVGFSFGERLQPDLAAQLRKRGLGAMRELYGSTETGIIGWRDTPTDPFTLFDHWQSANGALRRTRPDGQVRDMAPMDFLEWDSDRSFHLAGRRDGAVQIGAINVFPKKISEIICQHPEIKACTVRVASRSRRLDQLIAHIILEPGVSGDDDMAWKVDEWCRKKLRPSERPRIYTFENPQAGSVAGTTAQQAL